MMPESFSDPKGKAVTSVAAGVVAMFFVPWIHATVRFFKFMFWVALAVEFWLWVRPHLDFVPDAVVDKIKQVDNPVVQNAWGWLNRYM
jgi:hypothetical protein